MSIRSEYNRARKNAQARYRRLVNQGFYFDENPIPAIPKRITEGSIRRLNKLTAKELREQATSAFSIETGELTTPSEAYKERRRQTYKRQSEAQKHAYKMRQIDETIAQLTLNRPRRKGETHKEYIKSAERQREEERQQELEWEAEAIFNREFEEEFEDERRLSEEQYDAEIENAYASGEYEDARELERERDRYYPPEDENIAETSIDIRFGDAIFIIKQYSPEMAERIDNAYNEYLERTGGEGLDTSLSGKALEDFTDALANLEDIKYKGNEMAWWGIYTKIDKALNNKRHGAAEKRAFFGRLQSGDFNYE